MLTLFSRDESSCPVAFTWWWQSHFSDSLSLLLLQSLEEENAQQLAMMMTMVNRVEKLEQQLYTMQEERDRQQKSRWGMFSLQTR